MDLAGMLERIVEERRERLARANVQLSLDLAGDVRIEPADEVPAAVGHLVDHALARLERQRDRRLSIGCRTTGGMAVVEIAYPVREAHARKVVDAFHSGEDADCFGILGCRTKLARSGRGGRAYLGTTTGSAVHVVVELPIPVATEPASSRT